MSIWVSQHTVCMNNLLLFTLTVVKSLDFKLFLCLLCPLISSQTKGQHSHYSGDEFICRNADL